MIRSLVFGRGVVAAAQLLVSPAFLGATAHAQAAPLPVQTGAVVSRDTVTVGEVVLLSVRVHAPLGASINFPAAVDSLSPVQALDVPVVRNGSDSTAAADRIATYRIAAWDIGRQPVVLGEVLVQSDEGDRRVALALPTLFVRSVLPADTTLREPKPARPLIPAQAPFPWWWWVAGALAALAIGLGAWWWARRGNTGAAVPTDPYADAQASFARVEGLDLVNAGEPGRHAALMSDVTRRYLSRRISAASLAHTSGELLAAVRDAPTLSFEALRDLLDAVDPVKFGAASMSADRARELGKAARHIVDDEHARAETLSRVDVPSAPTERAA